MTKIRELFHKIGNLHNKICVAAGVSKAELEKKKDSPGLKEVERIIARLSEVEQTAVEASKDLRRLKDIIYGIIDPSERKSKE